MPSRAAPIGRPPLLGAAVLTHDHPSSLHHSTGDFPDIVAAPG